MVTAANLNLDVLELIFAYLPIKDLPSVALVSSSFLAGAIPGLYHTLSFRVKHAKRYPDVQTPFESIISHPALGVHVRKIDIRTTPIYTGKPHPHFMRECSRALELCKNLESFVYTPETVYNVVPMLHNKSRLRELRLTGNLSPEQARILIKVNKIERLTIDSASSYLLEVLPIWSASMSRSLSNLTLFMCKELNRAILDAMLRDLPNLTGLHVIGCPLIDHITLFSLLDHTPMLESLALTATETPRKLIQPGPTLFKLRNIAIELRPNPGSRAPGGEPLLAPTLNGILNYLKPSFAPLSSYTLKFNQNSKTPLGLDYIGTLIENFGHTLKSIAFYECSVAQDVVFAVATQCLHVEKLAIALPSRGMFGVVGALTVSSSLTTLIDVEVHTTHGLRATLKKDHIKTIMRAVPNLRKIVTGQRIWTGSYDRRGKMRVSFEQQTNLGPREHWFMPHN